MLKNYGKKDENELKMWPFWGRWHWKEHHKEFGLRRDEQRQINYDQNTWFVYDLNRDFQWGYMEMTSGMTHDQAIEIFDLIGKNPTTDQLTYYEVKAIAGHG